MYLPSRRLLFAVLASCFLTQLATAGENAADEAAIRKLVAQQEETWNSHDAKGYAGLFTEDGDCVNVVGWWWKGRGDIEKKLTDAFAFVFAESALKIAEIDVRFVSPELAIAHARWTMTGARVPTGGAPPPQQGIQTHVLQKSGGKWLIAAFQNTNSIPETPFPKGPGRTN